MAAVSGLALASANASFAQMHKVAAPEEVVRAVGVYEWTGDRAKPTASRLIPVTLFIDGELQDAGVYLARPVPLAIDSGTVYEIEKAGVAEGTLDVKYATHLQAADAAATYDDGWFGYGTFAPPPAPKKAVALKESKAPIKLESSKGDPDSDRPTFVRRHDSSASRTADSKASAGTSSTTTAATPPEDPDRPHLTRKPDASATASQTESAPATADSASTPASPTADSSVDNTPKSASTGSVPATDPDRPTLKKRSPEEAKKARKESQESGAVGLATSLNDDPNRPTLHHGKGQQALTEAELPKLKGIPVGIHQAVAVSDAKARPTHDFSKPWADDAERATVLTKMQTLAQAQIEAYKGTPAIAPPPSPVKRTPNSKLHHSTSRESLSPALAFQDERLSGYTLSYGGAATYVYTAHTAGDGASLRYVTIVAQMDTFGALQPAIQSVTDAAHLDRAPWMRLVDVVDVDASNRASLLFELRGQSARQFGLYRVIAGRSEQTFLSGTTQ